MNEKLQDAYKKYKENFNDDFPTIPLSETMEDKEIISMIEECIEKNKDVYELGYLSLNDVMY